MSAAVLVVLTFATAAQETSPYKAAANAEEAAARIAELAGIVLAASPNRDALVVDFRPSGGKFADAHLQYVPLLKNVVELHLAKTAVTDAGLRYLAGLKDLKVLNLYGTGIGDEGLVALEPLPNLRELYVWQTRATEAGIARLKKAMPRLQVTPDPERERRRTEAVWEAAKYSLANSVAALAAAEKDWKELGPLADALKKESEAAKKKGEPARKEADEAKKRADDAKRKSEEAARAVQGKPDDAGLKGRAAEARLQAEELDKKYREVLLRRDPELKALKEVQDRANKASRAKQAVDDARSAWESARLQEEEARKRLKE